MRLGVFLRILSNLSYSVRARCGLYARHRVHS